MRVTCPEGRALPREQHLTIARRYLTDVLSVVDIDAADELLAADVVCTVPDGSRIEGVEALKALLREVGGAFPHRDISIDFEVADEGGAAVVYTLRMTHTGDYQGLPASGREVVITGVDTFRIVDGKVAEIQVFYNPELVAAQLAAPAVTPAAPDAG